MFAYYLFLQPIHQLYRCIEYFAIGTFTLKLALGTDIVNFECKNMDIHFHIGIRPSHKSKKFARNNDRIFFVYFCDSNLYKSGISKKNPIENILLFILHFSFYPFIQSYLQLVRCLNVSR